jgi:hypothetical protein
MGVKHCSPDGASADSGKLKAVTIRLPTLQQCSFIRSFARSFNIQQSENNGLQQIY